MITGVAKTDAGRLLTCIVMQGYKLSVICPPTEKQLLFRPYCLTNNSRRIVQTNIYNIPPNATSMRPSLIIDLDGTLLHTNTFRDYLLFCGRSAVHAFRWDISVRILFWVMLRKLRIVSHAIMKRHLMQSTINFMLGKNRMDDFVEEELLQTDERVRKEMEHYRNKGHLLILATAAPAFYAKAIADDLRLDACLATLLPSEVVIGHWQENVGEEKVRVLQNFLKQHDLYIDAVITDHSDDLPLLRLHPEGPNLLVRPTPKTENLIRKEQIVFQTI